MATWHLDGGIPNEALMVCYTLGLDDETLDGWQGSLRHPCDEGLGLDS